MASLIHFFEVYKSRHSRLNQNKIHDVDLITLLVPTTPLWNTL